VKNPTLDCWTHTIYFVGVRRHGNPPPLEKAISYDNVCPQVFLTYREAEAVAKDVIAIDHIKAEVFSAEVTIPFVQNKK
jgi:hypothetical protein